jgi:hypothetical protein
MQQRGCVLDRREIWILFPAMARNALPLSNVMKGSEARRDSYTTANAGASPEDKATTEEDGN